MSDAYSKSVFSKLQYQIRLSNKGMIVDLLILYIRSFYSHL